LAGLSYCLSGVWACLRRPITFCVFKHDSLQRQFDGAIDDACLYDRVLSQGEIASLMGKTAPLSGPADLNVDGNINFKDYAELLDNWLAEVNYPYSQ